jgi:hypothetical protein
MRATAVLGWVKNRPRYSLAILFIAATGYAIDRWFFSGVMASKWIGLPQYASAMTKLQNESRNYGIVALALGAVALALALPRLPKQELVLIRNAPLTLSTERNAWTEYLGRCILHGGLCFLATFAFAILIPLIANFFWTLARASRWILR